MNGNLAAFFFFFPVR